MKNFNFRLQTKLNVSLRQEEIARENLQAHLNVRDEIAGQLQEIASKAQNLEQSLRDLSGEQIDFQEFVARREYLPVIHQQKKTVIKNLDQAETKVDRARDALIDRVKESSTLQKLREREWQSYMREVQQEEQKTIDELALSSHFRKKLVEV